MSSTNPKACLDCGEVKELSTRGLCKKCGLFRAWSATQQIRKKRGPLYERWLAGIKASLETEGVS